MIRVLLSLVLAVTMIGAGAASAAHALAHGAPQVVHDVQDMGADHAAALPDCCDATHAKVGGSCLADVVPSEMLSIGAASDGEGAIFPMRIAASPGIDSNVPTGPPKV